MKHIFTGLLLIFSLLGFSQDLMLIKFTDKPDSSYYYDNPTAMLSQKALDRRDKYDISLDSLDIPVNAAYINQIKDTGIEPIGISKWFNGIFAWCTESEIQAIENLDFILEISSFVNNPIPLISERSIDKFQIENQFQNTTLSTSEGNYGLATTQIDQINLQALFEEGFTGTGITIAVMDNGFVGADTAEGFAYMRDNNHLKGGYNFVDNNNNDLYSDGDHGTKVLSTLAGYLEEEYMGTAIDADYYLFITENNQHELPDEEVNWILAAEYADSLGVDIINTSLGYAEFDDPRYDYTYADMDGQTAYISRAGQIAAEKGMIPVTAAGNEGNKPWHYITTPADADGVFTIGAVDIDSLPAWFTSFGPTADGHTKPDVSALGADAAILDSSGIVQTANGTSFASPIIAGAMACLLQAFPQVSPEDLKQKVRKSASLFANPNEQLGYGIPDFGWVYDELLSVDNFEEENNLVVFPNPTPNLLNIKTDTPILQIQIISFEGKIIRKYSPTNQIELSEFPSGNYWIRFELENGQIGVKQIVKK